MHPPKKDHGYPKAPVHLERTGMRAKPLPPEEAVAVIRDGDDLEQHGAMIIAEEWSLLAEGQGPRPSRRRASAKESAGCRTLNRTTFMP